MKIAIIDGGESVFRAAAFGLPDREDIQRSYDRLERFSSNLSDRAKGMLNSAKTMISSLYDDTVRSQLKRLNSSKRGLYRDNIIQFLDSPEEVASAPLKMRRWLLSSPRTRSLWDRQSTHGWGSKRDAFVFETTPENDPYWKAIRNGVAEKNSKGEWWVEYTYGACDVEGEEHLTLEQQMELCATFDVINNAIDEGIDPFSPLGEKL
ncbi:hypothetical protein MOA67_gp317 [Klebsiella phage KpLz-2_45]|uniref:hypothetical protein n=1 Tax=Klebsiella phage KpLz-2_45 TaxID=2698923 RepID=UPI001F136291|nr:hypothetical protein MOA67_gp317 [Klebsiella phage KpLz-2_45]UKS72106.1 hypothetical protein KpLz245_2400 [Klebsiella phage KpLz-2_45]